MQHLKINAHNCVVAIILLLLFTSESTLAKRIFSGSNRKSSSSSSSGRVTPSYSSNAGSNSHADVAKLSYPNYNSQPNRPVSATNNQQPPPYGWNPPKQQGPPPAYSANNAPGGAKTNMHEAPPAYHAPPSYSAPPGATYHQPGHLPAGATYYPSAGHAAGGYNNYAAPGGYHPGAAGGYHPAPQIPPGATYVQPGAALPPGATYYAQPPQSSSSGLGFGTGLLAGGLGGALLGHALTPTHTQSVAAPAAAGAGDGGDRIIIINNGQPVNVTDAGAGTTVINAGQPAMPQNATDMAAPLAPMAAIPQNATDMAAMPGPGTTNETMPANATSAEQPPPGGIICVPVRVNQTDPNDATKMIEVDQVACYPAPPPPQQQQQADPNAPAQVPLAPLQPAAPDQQPQFPQDAAVRAANNSVAKLLTSPQYGVLSSVLLSLIYAIRFY